MGVVECARRGRTGRGRIAARWQLWFTKARWESSATLTPERVSACACTARVRVCACVCVCVRESARAHPSEPTHRQAYELCDPPCAVNRLGSERAVLQD